MIDNTKIKIKTKTKNDPLASSFTSSLASALEKTESLSRRKFVKMASAGLAVLSFPMISAFAFDAATKAKLSGKQGSKHSPKIVWVVYTRRFRFLTYHSANT